MMPAHVETLDEAALVRAVQQGDVAAFEPLLDRHLDHVRAFVALKLPVAHLVNEIAHETFVFAYRHIANFTPGTPLRAWLRAIAANLVRAEIQRYGREQTHQLGYARHRLLEAELAQPDAQAAAELEFLEQCVRDLPPAMCELLALRYTHELAVEKMAQQLGQTQTAVWQSLFRLRQQLRRCVEGKRANPGA